MQKEVIINSESDAWFQRNKDVLIGRKDFSYLNQVLKYINSGEKVLEIGSSFGYNLNFLVEKSGCHGYGLEPSGQAITFGEELYPDLVFKQGTIDSSDIFDTNFNHVIIGFCLYLVDVELLPEIVFRVNKILEKGGYLHIFDFDSKYPVEKDYAHDSRIRTRKMDYASLFNAFPNYFTVEKKSWSHVEEKFHINPNERCSTTTLFKEF